ncbi:MAG: hypothetical protein OXC31_04045 [Spirochaetaceae bacterium]|nr:hypothetical protein [Spirochaetaceae bacterium]
MPPDIDTYADWIKAGAHLDLLRRNALADELIIYASGDYTYVHTVVVPEDALNALDVDELFDCSSDPHHAVAGYCWGGGRDDVWIERSEAISGSKTLKGSRQLLFARAIPESVDRERLYYEVSQEYAHITEIHFLREHDAYCRFDKHGDLEHVVSLTTKSTPQEISLVTFKRDPLEEYLAANSSVLVQMFDFTLLNRSAFTAWSDTPEDLVRERNLFYRQKVDGKRAAYTNGVQIILPRKTTTELFAAIKGGHVAACSPQYVELIASDWRNKCVTNISTDPQATTNYFRAEGNSLPFELSPAFFRPDVLLKYKSDTDKYVVDDRVIRCRSAWELRRYDVNDAEQVHAYICDLRRLPYEEQLYWKSFNEEPKAGISKRAYINDFKGEWVELANPLRRIKMLLDKWREKKVFWWTLRDDAAITHATTPRTTSRDEWARAFSNLAKLVIEGFELRAIRARLSEKGIEWSMEERSLALLQRVLSSDARSGPSRQVAGLRAVQTIRSKVDAHVGGKESDQLSRDAIRDHGTYTAHFEHLCRMVLDELEQIERDLGDAEYGSGE